MGLGFVTTEEITIIFMDGTKETYEESLKKRITNKQSSGIILIQEKQSMIVIPMTNVKRIIVRNVIRNDLFW